MISTKGGARFHSNASIPGHHGAAQDQLIGNPTVPNPVHGIKRLASCREELEHSWQGATATGQVDYHCISNSESSDDNMGYGSMAKRRRTGLSSSSSVNDNEMMDCAFSGGGGIRICQSNRPPNRPQTKSQVKAGWYEGDVNSFGNRHGKGTTKHDDGTEYEGSYVDDIMSGPGFYKFLTTQHMVPNPHQNGRSLHRQIEKSFRGTFKEDVPIGAGMMITKTVDCAPQVLGSEPRDIWFTEEVFELGMHKNNAIGEGVRVIYSNTKSINGRSVLQKTCFRMWNGENTNTKVANDYATWMASCMGLEFPTPSITILAM